MPNDLIEASRLKPKLSDRDSQPKVPDGHTSIAFGVVFTVAIAGSAFALRAIPAISFLSPLILAIIIGMAWRNLFGVPAAMGPGIRFALRRLLRLGIILLGFQLTAAQVLSVGGTGMAIVIFGLVATFLFTVWLGRILGVDPKLAELIAAGTSICGASAVIAAKAVTRASDEDAAYGVACVTVFGSVAMFLYPLLPDLLAISPQAYGLWTGASIHEVAQVVAAAFQNGSVSGEQATIAKLSRVMMLAPMIIALGLLAHSPAPGESRFRGVQIPWFVLAFVAVVGINSVIALPTAAKDGIAFVTVFLLSVALAAMGLETSIGKLRAKGFKPLLLGFIASVFISAVTLALILCMET